MAQAFEAFAPFFEAWKNVAAKANDLRTSYKAATKGQSEAIDNLLASSDDATLVQWREFDAKASARITELVNKRDEAKATAKKHAQTLVPTVSDEDAEKIKTEYLTARKAANLTRENIKALLGNDEAALKAGIEHYGIVEVVGLGGTSTTSGATGIVRKRLASATIDGQPWADSKGKVTFTNLATHLKVDGQSLREAAEKAADVESVRDIPNGTTVEFEVTVGDKKHTVSITTPSDDDEKESEKSDSDSE